MDSPMDSINADQINLKGMPRAVEAWLSKVGFTALPTEDEWAEEDRCCVHRRVEHGVEGAAGCRGRPAGTLPSIAALYRDTPVHACLAKPEQRLLDVKLCRRVLRNDIRGRPYVHGAPAPKERFLRGREAFTMAQLGAGYCYSGGIHDRARVWTARVLGPAGYAVDIARLLTLVGKADVPWFKIVRTGEDLFHVEWDSTRWVAGTKCVGALMLLVQSEGEQVRIGATSMSDWLATKGVVIGGAAAKDMALVEAEANHHSDVDADGTNRFRLMAVMGIGLLDAAVAAVAMTQGLDSASCSALRQSLGVKGLAYVFDADGVTTVCLELLSARRKADMLRAMLAVVVMRCGIDAVISIVTRWLALV